MGVGVSHAGQAACIMDKQMRFRSKVLLAGKTATGVSDNAFSNDGVWGDFNGDGWSDLYVGDEGADHLYQNDGDGTFTDVTSVAGVSDPNESQSACWGDQDADGRLDLYVVDIDAPGNHLYENDGDGTFTDITASAGVGDVGDGRTCNWVDFFLSL